MAKDSVPSAKTVNSFEKSRRRVLEAGRYLPGGVGSDFRLRVSPTPLVIDRAEGPFVYDVDGNQLIDYYLGMGPMILGHNPASVTDAVQRQLQKGILYGGQSEPEYEAARLVCEMVPCAERVRFGSSGSEIVQAAIRLARAATGRKVIVKFEGHYHGWLDNIMWSVAPTVAQLESVPPGTPIPSSDGQDPAAGNHVMVLPWNDSACVEERLKHGDVAGVIMEPVMCNTGVVLPAPGYLERVRRVCDECGVVLIFDEVITGFRVGPGGAQLRLRVTPDLATFGKAISNGFPVACLAGRARLMDLLGVTGHVVHAGTYNGQPIMMAATVAALTALNSGDAYQKLDVWGTRLMRGIDRILRDAGEDYRIQGWPQVFNVALGIRQPIVDYRSALLADRSRYIRLTTALQENGVRCLERGTWFTSIAHDEHIIDQTLESLQRSVSRLKS